MTLKERYEGICGWFAENMPDAASELHFDSAFHLLVAVVLSAQCTDKRVNQYTPEIFRRFPTPADMAASSFEEIYGLIKSISFPNSKAAHLLALSRKLVSDFGGQVPDDIEALQTLPGVGRKTANVVTSVIYGRPVIAVDTHVFRVSHRLGLSNGATPGKVEEDLERHIEPSIRPKAHHWLILHGRYVCTARSPKCGECGLKPYCKLRNKESALSKLK